VDEGFRKSLESHVYFFAAHSLDQPQAKSGVVENVALGKAFFGAVVAGFRSVQGSQLLGDADRRARSLCAGGRGGLSQRYRGGTRRGTRRGTRGMFAKSMICMASVTAYASDARIHHSEDGMRKLHAATGAISVDVCACFMKSGHSMRHSMKRRPRRYKEKVEVLV